MHMFIQALKEARDRLDAGQDWASRQLEAESYDIQNFDAMMPATPMCRP